MKVAAIELASWNPFVNVKANANRTIRTAISSMYPRAFPGPAQSPGPGKPLSSEEFIPKQKKGWDRKRQVFFGGAPAGFWYRGSDRTQSRVYVGHRVIFFLRSSTRPSTTNVPFPR